MQLNSPGRFRAPPLVKTAGFVREISLIVYSKFRRDFRHTGAGYLCHNRPPVCLPFGTKIELHPRKAESQTPKVGDTGAANAHRLWCGPRIENKVRRHLFHLLQQSSATPKGNGLGHPTGGSLGKREFAGHVLCP